jgi:hypothetical protein
VHCCRPHLLLTPKRCTQTSRSSPASHKTPKRYTETTLLARTHRIRSCTAGTRLAPCACVLRMRLAHRRHKTCALRMRLAHASCACVLRTAGTRLAPCACVLRMRLAHRRHKTCALRMRLVRRFLRLVDRRRSPFTAVSDGCAVTIVATIVAIRTATSSRGHLQLGGGGELCPGVALGDTASREGSDRGGGRVRGETGCYWRH